jgi:hypothetical protein
LGSGTLGGGDRNALVEGRQEHDHDTDTAQGQGLGVQSLSVAAGPKQMPIRLAEKIAPM